MLYLRSFNRFILISLALLGLSVSSVNAAVVWDWNGSQLLGAQNVDVGGTLYDVQFVDGTCVELFNGCDELSDFLFTTLADALLASQALLDQVFLDTNDVGQQFDFEPGFTNGCALLSVCAVDTPYGFDVPNSEVLVGVSGNQKTFATDFVLSSDRDIAIDHRDLPHTTYAVWTEINPVPIPAAVWLFGTALIGLIGFGKRRKTA